MNLKAQAVFAIAFQINLVCVIFIFSNQFGMGYEHDLFEMEMVFLPGYNVSYDLLMTVLVLFNVMFFMVYLPVRAKTI